MMTTLADGMVPAAVINIGKYFPSRLAASNTALYPAMFACDDNASMDCARVMRGTSSMAKELTLPAANVLTMGRFR